MHIGEYEVFRKSIILNGMELYHVLNRGVEKRDLFMSTGDRARFVHDMYEFNDSKPARNAGRDFDSSAMIDFVNQSLDRSRIVDIHGWCLMKNHYHLLLSELVEGGLTMFIRKLNVGYANYFNQKYKRVGTLFQGRTKRVRITSDAHFLHILHYIHLNPLDFISAAKAWRLGRIQNPNAARAQLEKYRWSSYQDYSGKKNFPSILTMDFMRDSLGDVKKKTLEYIEDADFAEIKPLLLE